MPPPESARGPAQSKSWRTGPGSAQARSVLECGPDRSGPLYYWLDGASQFHKARRIVEHRIPWPHAPTHQLSSRGTYFVTASTYQRTHHFPGRDRLAVLHRGLLTVARDYRWDLEAWAVFSNHYHFVAHSPPDGPDASSLADMLRVLHVKTAGWINKLDRAPGRQVWFNFWETRLTYQRSYLSRLNYVHQNAVKHRLVPVANQYPWCSARWFERSSSPAMVNSVYRFKIDRLQVMDEFEPAAEW